MFWILSKFPEQFLLYMTVDQPDEWVYKNEPISSYFISYKYWSTL